VVRASAYERDVARPQGYGRLTLLGPEPHLPLDDRMDSKLDSRQPQPPRRVCRGASEQASRSSRPDQVLL
jgi:hypothetical protein